MPRELVMRVSRKTAFLLWMFKQILATGSICGYVGCYTLSPKLLPVSFDSHGLRKRKPGTLLLGRGYAIRIAERMDVLQSACVPLGYALRVLVEAVGSKLHPMQSLCARIVIRQLLWSGAAIFPPTPPACGGTSTAH